MLVDLLISRLPAIRSSRIPTGSALSAKSPEVRPEIMDVRTTDQNAVGHQAAPTGQHQARASRRPRGFALAPKSASVRPNRSRSAAEPGGIRHRGAHQHETPACAARPRSRRARAGAAAQAKTLVYCSEGSPENFNPMINTTGTTFDANLPIYNRLVEFKPGTTEVEPGLAEKWEVSAGRQDVHVPPAPRRQVAVSNKNFKPTRDFNADDVIFSFERQWKDSNPYHKVSGGNYGYFGDMDLPKLLKSIDKVDRLHGALHAQRAAGAVPGRPGDGFRLHPVEGIRRRPDEGRQAGADRPGADRHRPVRVRHLQQGQHHPLPGLPAATGARSRRSTRWCSPSPRTRRCGWPSCAPTSAR